MTLEEVLVEVERLTHLCEDMVVDYGQLQIQLHEAQELVAHMKPVYDAALRVIYYQKRGEEPGLYELRLAVDAATGVE